MRKIPKHVFWIGFSSNYFSNTLLIWNQPIKKGDGWHRWHTILLLFLEGDWWNSWKFTLLIFSVTLCHPSPFSIFLALGERGNCYREFRYSPWKYVNSLYLLCFRIYKPQTLSAHRIPLNSALNVVSNQTWNSFVGDPQSNQPLLMRSTW